MKFRALSLLIPLAIFLTPLTSHAEFEKILNKIAESIEDKNGNSNDTDANWKRYRGDIPINAVRGGRENGQALYVCQARYGKGMHPGKVVADNCNITYAGSEIQRPSFRVLVGRGYRWKYNDMGNIPDNAVVGGYERGQPLYICQARHAGGIHPGKVVAGYCNIGYGGAEVRKDDFRILVKSSGGGGRWDDDDDDDNGAGSGIGSGAPGSAPGSSAPGSSAPGSSAPDSSAPSVGSPNPNPGQ